MARRRGIRVEDLFRLKFVGRAVLSPGRDRVVFELKRLDAGENKNFVQLMLVELGTGEVRPLTDGPHSDTLPKFSPEGTRLAFISTREKTPALYVLPLTGGEPRRLTSRDGQVHDFAWSPDGRRIAFTWQPLNERELAERDGRQEELRKRPQFKHITRLCHKLDGAGWWNGHYRHIWLLNSDGSGRPKQITGGNADDFEPRFSPDGRWITFVSNRVKDPDLDRSNADLYAVRPTGGELRRRTRAHGRCQGHAWSPDGRWIAFIGDLSARGEAWKHVQRVCLVPSSGGVPRELTTQIDNHCLNMTLGDTAGITFEAVPPLWSEDSREVTFLVSDAGAVHVYSQRIDEPRARRRVGGAINVYWLHGRTAYGRVRPELGVTHAAGGAAPNPAGPELVYCAGTQTDPGEVYTLKPDDEGRRLTAVNRATLAQLELSQPEPFRVRSGGATIHGWLLKPPRFRADRRYPAILEIHGGPHTQYGHAMFHEMQLLASRGFVVCFANPRGSAGYGIEFQRCIHCDWGNLDYQDLMRVTDWLAGLPFVDKARLGVTGGSYGGYMTNWIIGHTSRFRAAVTQRSVVSLESMFGTSDYGWEFREDYGERPWNPPARARQQSPLTHLKDVRTPLLIEHEEEDHRCPIEQADQLFTLLKALGKDVEYIRFEGESHGLSRGGRPQNRAERLRRIVAWFERHLRP